MFLFTIHYSLHSAIHEDVILTEPKNEDLLQPVIDDIQDPLCFVADSSDQVQEPQFHAELSKDVNEDKEDSGPLPAIEELHVAKAFLDGIKATTLRNDGLPEYVLEWLLSPPQEVADASDPDL